LSRDLKSGALVLTAFLAGATITGFGAWRAIAAWESRTWPVAAGVVQHSQVERRHRRGKHHSVNYQARVEYAYSVEGRYYRSSRISFGDAGTGFRAPARWIVDRYPITSEVIVHYDPEDPESAVLVAGITIGSAGIVLVGLGVCVGSLLAHSGAHRKLRLPRWD